MKKKIGVVVAIEIDSVLKKYGEPKKKDVVAGCEILAYETEDYELFVIHSGAGEINAAAGTQILISLYGVEKIINFGVVGALTADMTTTELCVVEKVVHYDFDARDWLGIPKGQYPDNNSVFFETDKELLDKATEIAPELKKVVCASADKFVASPEAKSALNKEFGADICEMESAGIVITCAKNKIPCLLIKAISDSLLGGDKEFLKELGRVSEICFDVADKVIKSI